MDKIYKLQIYPSYEVGAQVKKFKRMLFNRIGEYRYYHSLPHISLLSFSADARMEHELVEAVRKAMISFSSFSLSVRGFSHFHQNGTLYLQVENQPYLQMLNRHIHASLRQHASRKGISLHDLRVYHHPHMTIGSDLSAAELAVGFDLLMDKDYSASFEVRQVKFLSFSLEKGANELISEFELTGNPLRLGSANPDGPVFGPSGTILPIARIFGGSTGQQLSLFGL